MDGFHLVQYAYPESGVKSMTVGCADCDMQMYGHWGFQLSLETCSHGNDFE